jgi:Predicted carbamoyl transferase, NodU family
MAVAYGTGYIPPVTFVKHHKAHAAAAYYASGYTEPTLVVSIDGQGEDESTTIWLAKEGKLEKIASTTPFTNSLGHFYHIITVYLGYRRHDEGKVMGYAPYGAPRNAAEEKIVAQLRGMMQELIRFNRKTEQIEMNPEDFESTTMAVFPGIKFSEKFLQRLSKIVPPMPEGKTGRDLQPEDRNRAHLAFAMQERVEQVITDMIAYYLNVNDKTKGVRYVVMTGGLALNIASNGRLIENGTVEADKFFVPAYPADDGTSVGAALSVADEEYGLDVQSKVTKISLGKTYSDKEIKNTLDFLVWLREVTINILKVMKN